MGLSLKVLGAFSVRDGSGAALSLPTRKTRALLGYLAANADRPQQRERLTALLWSDFGEKQARHNLNQALLSIRKLGAEPGTTLLETDGERVTLRSAAIDIDLVRFRALLASNPAQASSLYEGPFLDGIAVRDTAFGDWLSATRTEIHDLACDALERTAATGENGDMESALAAARRLVALDPLRESGHRQLMSILQKSGDRAAALRQYQTCAEILKTELQVEPDAATKALYEAIRQGADTYAAAPPAKSRAHESINSGRLRSGEKPSIAIMPFANLSGDPSQNYLVDGIQLSIYATLIKISGLFLIAANSVSNYQQDENSAVRAGQGLGARYILEGAVQTAGNHIRVTVQLTDSRRRKVVWGEQYDRIFEDVFAMQDEIALEVLSELDIKLISGEEARVFRRTLTKPEARETHYRALSHFYANTKADNAVARELFKSVASIQPDSPEGPSYLCFTYWLDIFRGWTDNTSRAMSSALEWAEKASEYEGNNGLGYIVLAADHLVQHRHDDALETCTKAYDYRPSCPAANGYLANILHYCGESREAIVRAKVAMRVMPNAPPWFNNVLAAAYREHGEIESSIATATNSILRDEGDIEARAILCSDHAMLVSLDDAKRVAQEILAIDPDFSLAHYAGTQPFRDEATLDRLIASLRRAGLPD